MLLLVNGLAAGQAVVSSRKRRLIHLSIELLKLKHSSMLSTRRHIPACSCIIVPLSILLIRQRGCRRRGLICFTQVILELHSYISIHHWNVRILWPWHLCEFKPLDLFKHLEVMKTDFRLTRKRKTFRKSTLERKEGDWTEETLTEKRIDYSFLTWPIVSKSH